MTVTLKQIAKKTGVSMTTVSRVLNEKGDISSAVRKKVRETAERMGYYENKLAKGYLFGKSNLVGIVLDWRNEFQSKAGSVILTILQEAGYLPLALSNGEREKDVSILRNLLEFRAAGMIMLPQAGTLADPSFQTMLNSDIASIFIANRVQTPLPCLWFDEYSGGIAMAEYLYSKGCRSIGYVSGPDYLESARAQRLGMEFFAASHKDLHLRVVSSQASDSVRTELLEAFCEAHAETDAFAGYLNSQALSIHTFLTKKNRPAIVLGGDGDFLKSLSCPFPALFHDAEKLGETAANILLSRLAEKQTVATAPKSISCNIIR